MWINTQGMTREREREKERERERRGERERERENVYACTRVWQRERGEQRKKEIYIPKHTKIGFVHTYIHAYILKRKEKKSLL